MLIKLTLSYVFVNWYVHFHWHVSRFACVKFQTNSGHSVFITVYTVVRNCCTRFQLQTPIFRPQGSKTPELMDIKLDRGNYVGDLTRHANFGISALTGGDICVKLSSSVSIFNIPRCYYVRVHLHRSTFFGTQCISMAQHICTAKQRLLQISSKFQKTMTTVCWCTEMRQKMRSHS